LPKGSKASFVPGPRRTRGLQPKSRLICADNTGAKELEIISVIGYKGVLRRRASAMIGDMVVVSVKKGTPEMRKQVLYAVIIRQRQKYRREDGIRIFFEDNAAIITNPDGSPKGSEIRGPVAREAVERWPKIAGAASIVV